MLKLYRYALLIASLLVNAAFADVDDDPSFQGASGLINVPSGATIGFGEFYISYNNLVDSLGGRFGPGATTYIDGNDFNFVISPFPGVEFGMRSIGDDVGEDSDLPTYLKYSPTFIPEDWFDLAFGVQAVGGETNDVNVVYASLSKTWRDFRFTVGTSRSKNGEAENLPSRLDNNFYGVEYQPFEWLVLMMENDGTAESGGIKLKSPPGWLKHRGQFFVSAVIKEEFDDGPGEDNFYFNVGFRGSLFSSDDVGLFGRKRRERQLADSLNWLFNDSDWEEYEPIEIGLSKYRHLDDNLVNQLGVIKRKITRQGFEGVWLGFDQEKLFIRFENSIYNRNDLDAIGIVLGIAAEMTPEGVTELDLTLSKYGVPTFRFAASREEVRSYYDGETHSFRATPGLPSRQQIGDMVWLGGSKSPYLVPRISFHPMWRNFVGTELGVLDYSLALRTNITVPVWRGAEIIVDYDTPIAESSDFDRTGNFNRWTHDEGVKNFFFRQTTQLPGNIYATMALGRSKEMLFEVYDTVAAEGMWQSPGGAHRFSLYGAYLDSRLFPDFQREIYVGGYRYYSEALDMSFSIESGQFWRQDRGVKVSTKFNFGDTRVEIFARDTDVKSVGIAVSIPLTLRRDMRPGRFQIKGKDSWTYQLSTRTDSEGQNLLAPQRGYRPDYLNHLESTYFNDDRLSVDYMEANMGRLRAAFLELLR